MKIKLAFYKGDGNILDKFVKYMTDGKYSRVAIIDKNGQWYFCVPNEGVIKKNMNPNHTKYDYVEIDCDQSNYNKAIQFLNNQLGKSNNYLGLLLSKSFHFLDYEERWFSSELAANFLNIIKRGDINSSYFTYSPSSLLDKLIKCQSRYGSGIYKFIEGSQYRENIENK